MLLLATPEDRQICQTLLRSARWREDSIKPLGELTLAVGAYFLGAPYAPNTLERDSREELIINLRQFDCYTFVENTVVLAGLIKAGKTSFSDFAASLTAVRYRNGLLDGYASRLHYFSDWLYDNQEKGIIKNITRAAGGKRFSKKINFMTSNRNSFPALQGEDEFTRMRSVENSCSKRSLYYIPKAGLKTCTDKIEDGDLIAITTDIEGLDVVHVGIAVHIKNGLHLLHASQEAGKVVISGDTLYRYLARRKSRSGIMTARVL
jgi:hypothetical protein